MKRQTAILGSARRHFTKGGACQNGFTLLEVMISLAILAVGVTLTLSLISGSLNHIRKVQMRTRTIEHAETVLELALLDNSTEKPMSFKGDFEDGTRWTVYIEEYNPPDDRPQAQTGLIPTPTLPIKLLAYTVEVASPDATAPDYRLQTLKLVKTSPDDKLARPR